jgi:hypothetical protein
MKVLLAGDSRYSMETTRSGFWGRSWVFLGCGIEWGFFAAIRVGAPCSKCCCVAGWLLGLREDLGQSVLGLFDQGVSGW